MLGLIEHEKYKHLAEALEAALLSGPDDMDLPPEIHVEELARTLTHRSRKSQSDKLTRSPRISRVVGGVPSLSSNRDESHRTTTLTTSTITDSADRGGSTNVASILWTEQRQNDTHRRYAKTRPPDMKAMDRRQ